MGDGKGIIKTLFGALMYEHSADKLKHIEG